MLNCWLFFFFLALHGLEKENILSQSEMYPSVFELFLRLIHQILSIKKNTV